MHDLYIADIYRRGAVFAADSMGRSFRLHSLLHIAVVGSFRVIETGTN